MKLIIFRLALVLAAFTIVPNALAADTDSGNVFVDAKVGKMFGKDVADDSDFTSNSPTAWGADGGYLWKLKDGSEAGFDVGYMHFGHILDENDALGFSSAGVSASAMTAGGHLRIVMGEDSAWFVQLRAGFMRLKLDESFLSFIPGQPVTAGSDSSTQSGVYFGGGIGRDITQDLSLILAYEHYSSNSTSGEDGNQAWT